MTSQYTRRVWLTRVGGIVAAAVALPTIAPRRDESMPTVLAGTTMGTTYRATLPRTPAGIGAQELEHEMRELLGRLDASMSTYRLESDLSRFNRAAPGEWVAVSAETSAVAAAAMATAALTEGAFDPTIGPLVDLWGFGPAGPSTRLPDTAAVASTLARIGWSALEVRRQAPAICKRRDHLQIDFSGIAEGYAVDRMARRLDQLGLHDYLIELGGEVRCRGRNPARLPWIIEVETPGHASDRPQTRLEVTDVAIATSGDYRKFFVIDGRRYSHVIDPRQGQPINHRLASVTVVGDDAMQCDALATALLVMGPEAGFAFAERHRIAAMFTTRLRYGYAERMSGAFDVYLGATPA